MPGKWGRKNKEVVTTSTEPDNHVSATIDHTVVSDVTKHPKAPKTGKKFALRGIKAWDKKKRVKAGALALLIALLVGVGLYALLRNNDDDPSIRDVRTTSEGVVLRQVDKDKLQTEVEQLVFQKKSASAVELIRYQTDFQKSKEQQLLLYSVYANQSKHTEALSTLLAIEKSFDEDWKVSRNIAVQHEALKNKSEALRYYQQALDQLNKVDDPVKGDEIYFLQNDIKRVGG